MTPLMAALEYCRQGLSIIPIKPGDKKPLIAWEEYQTRRATEEEIKTWWDKWSNANVGVVTGAISGLIVIDLDTQEAKDNLKNLLAGYDLTVVPRSRTGKGWQLFFKYPGAPIQNRAGIIPGLDVRGDGGYVVAPPSIHPNGRAYHWEVPINGELPNLPVKLHNLISTQSSNESANGHRERFNTGQALNGVPEGKRDDMAWRLVCNLHHAGVPQDWAERLILEAARNCQPSFPEAIALEKVHRAYGRNSGGGDSFRSPKKDIGKETIFKPLSATEILSRAPEEIPWIWNSYIAKGNLFLLVAYMKVGKTTFAYPLVLAIARGATFLDRDTKQGGILILAVEEHPRDVENRLKGLGMREDDPIYVHEGFLPNSDKELEAVRAFILEKEITLVLVDSLSVFWNVGDENNNAAIVREVKPLLALARDTEAAVGLVHHDSKTGGSGGRNIRGGSALFGLVDQAIMLDKLPGETGNKRLLKTLGRYAESPSELVIELEGNEYEVVGTREEVGRQVIMDKAEEALTNDPQDVKTLAQDISESQKATRQALEGLRSMGRAVRRGGGKRNDPYIYHLPDSSDSFLSQPSSIGNETNLEKSGERGLWTREY